MIIAIGDGAAGSGGGACLYKDSICHGEHIEVRKQFSGVNFLFPLWFLWVELRPSDLHRKSFYRKNHLVIPNDICLLSLPMRI